MGQQLIVVNSITYAYRGRDLLEKQGIHAQIKRVHDMRVTRGCGYCLSVKNDASGAVNILANAGIRILGMLEE